MPKDLRTYIEHLARVRPQDIKVIEESVDPRLGLTAVAQAAEKRGEFPALYFRKVEGSNLPVLLNLCATYERLALSIDASVDRMGQVYGERQKSPIPHKLVSEAPSQEVVLTGEEATLSVLPICTHNGLDGGPFLTIGTLICKDPDTGAHNLGIYRHHVQGAKQLGVWFWTGHHGDYVRQRCEELKQRMDVAIAIGHHPAFVMGAVSRVPGIGGEYEEAGALLGEPVEVVPGKTVDLLVPARAEIIIEGYIGPGERYYEGPFGEWPGHYSSEGDKPFIHVTAITMRRDAIFLDLFGAHREHTVLGSLPRMGSIYRRAKEVVPGVTAVNVPAHARMHCYISIKKSNDAEVKKAAFAALNTEPENLKMVIVVDDDINVFNESEVMWAVGTRFTADKDLLVIPDWQNAGGLNPGNYEYHADGTKTPRKVAGMILDATKPSPPIPYPPRALVPEELVARVDLERMLKDFSSLSEDSRARVLRR